MRIYTFLTLVVALLVFMVACDDAENINGQDAECTVNFYNEGEYYCTTIATVGMTVSKPTDPQREGYDFVGWYDGDRAWDFSTDKVMQGLALDAQWRINLKSTFSHYAEAGAELDPDGEYMKIMVDLRDTRNEKTLKMIKDANKTLGLPDGVYRNMISTIHTDGFKTAEGDMALVEWTCDAENCLFVTYYRK